MFDFTNNYFLSTKSPKVELQSSSPSNYRSKQNKRAVCLYLDKIIKSKINKETSFALGKIMLQGFPKLSMKKQQTFDNSTASQLFSSRDDTPNITPFASPKNSIKLDPTFKTAKILKKRSSLNQTRTIQTEKTDCQVEPNVTHNPERTYAINNTDKINKQYDGFKMMQLSPETRNILQKIVRLDKRNFAFQIQKLCKNQFMSQVKNLQKIKNSSKDMRGEIYDNQLTMSVLNSNIKLISQLNKEVQQLTKINNQNQKQLRRKRQEQTKQHKSSQKLQKHLGNVQSRMKILTDRIDQHLSNRQLSKALIGIGEFMKKYQGQQFAKQKIYFYNLIKDRISDYKQIQKCLDEVCRILGVLCIANLNQTDACLRSMNANHTSFKFIKRTYGDVDKFYGKQMINILHNLEKFNNNIIKYLETKKQVQKQINKPTGIQQLKKEHNIEINNLNMKIDEYKRKVALLEVQIEKKNYKLNNIDTLVNSNQSSKKIQWQFERTVTDILQKIANKKEYKKQLQSFRKNPLLNSQKPYSQFINLTFALQRSYDDKIKSQMDSLSETFNQISKVFRKQAESQQVRFKQLNKLLQHSSKKNVFYFDLHRFLQSLMFTIVKNTKEQKNHLSIDKKQSKVEQITIRAPLQKKRSRRFSENLDDLNFQAITQKCGKTCVDREESPPKSVGFYNQQQQDLGGFDQKQLLKTLQLFLNKVSPILHKPATGMQEKLAEVEQLSQKFIVNNYKYKQFFTTIQNWMSFAISRLDIKTKI